MSNSVRVRVPAKVNLALRVGGTDARGYHDLGTVFQAVWVGDEILAEASDPGEFKLVFHGEGAAFLPVDDTNLAIRAAKLLARHADRSDVGVSLTIRKRIPVAGGMAGGSADAAGTLLACARLWDLGLERRELEPLAAELGSDVPFILVGGTAIGTGRGVDLAPLMTSGTLHWTFALSHTGLSTPAVFREFDRTNSPNSTEIPRALIEALRAGDAPAVGAALCNDLEASAIALQPTLEHTLRIGREAGALGAIVTGSGPTCAFLAGSEAHSQQLAEALAVFSGVRAVRRAYGPVQGAQVMA